MTSVNIWFFLVPSLTLYLPFSRSPSPCVCVCLLLSVCPSVYLCLSVSHDHTFTGNAIFDQMVSMFLSISPFVGGIVGLVLDNTLPGQCSMTSKAHHLDILEKPNIAFKSPESQRSGTLWRHVIFVQTCTHQLETFL